MQLAGRPAIQRRQIQHQLYKQLCGGFNAALTLEVAGELWTSDRELESGLRRQGFTRFFTPGQRE